MSIRNPLEILQPLVTLGSLDLPFPVLATAGEEFQEFLNVTALALIEAVLSLFSGFLEMFLFPPPPREVPGLELLWDRMVIAFFSIISITMVGYFGYMLLFPEDTNSDPFRMINRLFVGVVLVIAGKPILNSAFVATNTLGQVIYPNTFKISVLANASNNALAGMGVEATLTTIILGAYIMYSASTLSIVLLLAMLAMRALLLYTVFSVFPVFIGLWIVDVGPFEYGKLTADVTFKAFGLLLAFGILISAILATGAAISAGAQQPVDAAAEYENLTNPDKNVEPMEPPEDSSLGSMEYLMIILVGAFGSFWASLATGGAVLGMLISVRGGSGPGALSRAHGAKKGYEQNGLKGAYGGATAPRQYSGQDSNVSVDGDGGTGSQSHTNNQSSTGSSDGNSSSGKDRSGGGSSN